MSAVIEEHHHDGHHHGPDKGIMRWVLTTNHKDIGTLYLWFSFLMFLTGGVLALGKRGALERENRGRRAVHRTRAVGTVGEGEQTVADGAAQDEGAHEGALTCVPSPP